jgi:hypothetical protein
MNLTQLKRNVGMAIKLQPAACHLDAYGEALSYPFAFPSMFQG